MNQFKFKGDWEFEYEFAAFKGLQSRRGAYTSMNSKEDSNGIVNVIITDELNEEPDPTMEQINAINYLISNPNKIKSTLFKALEEEYPKLKEIYGYDEDDEDSREWFPTVEILEDFKNVFGIGNVFILLPNKDGFAYVGLECGCNWDEEHGLGFLLHKDRLIKIGGADEAFSEWEAFKDNGTYEEKQKEWNEIHLKRVKLPKPKIYKPDPKYGKLKPSQISANNMYENHLIERGYNREFRDLVETGRVDINENKGLSMTFLERAAQFNNEEIVKYIISKKPNSTKGVIHNLAGHCNKSLVEHLLNTGIDINEEDQWKRTILSITEQRIEGLKRNNNTDLSKYEEFAEWLKLKGAN